jgi:hypothetical protein
MSTDKNDTRPERRPEGKEEPELIRRIVGGVIGRDFDEIMHILWETAYADEIVQIFRRTLETGAPYLTSERVEHRRDRGVVEYYEWRLDRITLPDGRFGLLLFP